MNPLKPIDQATSHVMAVQILCRTLIHLAYLSLAVSAALQGKAVAAICWIIFALVIPAVVTRISKVGTDRRAVRAPAKEQSNG